MKKITSLFLFLILLQGAVAQKTIVGTWQGKLTVSGTSLRLVVHIKDETSGFSATLDSPDQGAKGITVSRVEKRGDSLILEIAAAGARLSGRLTSDTTFSGEWSQGINLPIQLTKLPEGETVSAPKRPQTPKPPFPYSSTDVIYYNRDHSIQFGGTITKPTGAGPFPTVLLLTGSGQQNRDEELFDHKPFAVLADYLTRRGYLVLRVDDRGVGQTTGDAKNATTRDFADDAMAGLDYLKTLPAADKERMGLLGHSEGGMIAQLVAAQRNDLAFVVLLAAPGEKVIDLMVHQNGAILRSAGMQLQTVESYLTLYRSLVTALVLSPAQNQAGHAIEIIDDWLKKTPPAVVAATTGITDEKSKENFLRTFEKGINTAWYRYFLQYDPDVYVRNIRASVLALNGDKDIQVLAKPNLAALKASLQKGKAKRFDIVEISDLNHLFQHCTKCIIAEYGQLEETIAPEVLETMGNWLDKNVKTRMP